MFKRVFVFIILVLIFDFIFVVILKKINYWENFNEEAYWRIKSEIYHHDILPNTNVYESWGNAKYKLVTNSLGFRDFQNKTVKKTTSLKKRLILIGDSFTEGVGLKYQDSLAGQITSYLKKKKEYEVLNLGVGSYSPTNYYYKTKNFMERGYEFDKAIVFLDVTDMIDEIKYSYNEKDELVLDFKKFQYKKKNFSKNLENHFLSYKVIMKIRDKIGNFKKIIKNEYIEDGIGASKLFNKNFFDVGKKDRKLYAMIENEMSNWTSDDDKLRYNLNNTQKGLDRGKKNLIRLFNLFKENEIEGLLVIYPHPAQIYRKNSFYESLWTDFAKDNNINFLNTFPAFHSDNDDAENFILNNFIHGDIHWNNNGVEKIFNFLIKKAALDF
tara:strand:+ start:302 stop:1450 length:1149 start_codon:yes stop_codon:yes gene_type:complete